jgi:putative CocE/NonD family hydrolase
MDGRFVVSEPIRRSIVNVLIEKDVAATMRDGTVLRADVYRPADDERHGVLLLRTPYNKDVSTGSNFLDPVRAASQGFVVIIQDTRGRWASDGEDFYLFRDEFHDGYDTVQWAAGLPYSNGNVAEHGVSYGANTSWQTAIARPPALRAIAPSQSPDYFLEGHQWLTRSGTLQWGMIVNWSLRSIGPGQLYRQMQRGEDPSKLFDQLADDLDDYDRWIRHVPMETFPPARLDDPDFLGFFHNVLHRRLPQPWDRLDVSRRVSEITVPALTVAGWYDVLLGADIEYYQTLRDHAGSDVARAESRLLIGPWSHSNFVNFIGDVDFGMRSSSGSMDLREDLTTFLLRWFGHWLHDTPADLAELPRARVFVMGINRWADFSDWPPPGVRAEPWYFQAGGGLSPRPPDTDGGSSSYLYDPVDPCPTVGGGLVLPGTIPPGPKDQRVILGRRDVLSFTSEPFERELTLAGPVKVLLHATTTATDTDWMAKLCDVDSNGRSLNLCDGILRASYRDGSGVPSAVTPGAVLEYEVDLWATAAVIAPGHRIQVIVTSSDFPRYDRNPNTGASLVDTTGTVPALQTIHHDGLHASHVVLPVLS